VHSVRHALNAGVYDDAVNTLTSKDALGRESNQQFDLMGRKFANALTQLAVCPQM
jgi:hypothetical protein